MERLEGEARDRVRAMSLWLVVAIVLLVVIVGLWAIFIGFPEVRPVPSTVAGVSPDGRELTVELSHGSCEQPHEVTAEESSDAVIITAYVFERRPLRGRDCTPIAAVARETVVLKEPLGDRELRDGGG